ncbi:MAG: NADH-quinone oxidoreductase subunit H [Phycisphaerae bacterium]|nr:NADH-quinone oxidoreductase subunit H [Phycisphaerae bacterium]
MTILVSLLHVLLALTLSPLLVGVIRRTKAIFAGRQGPSLFQMYSDLAKLFRKGAVYSRTTTWIFRAGPIVGVAAVIVALMIVPLGGVRGLAEFPGDLILLAYVLGLMRFMTVLAALDTGSAFEGMGASREVQFSLLAEPALLLGLAATAVCTRRLGLSEIYANLFAASPITVAPTAVLLAGMFLIVLLAENARIPVDDPATHLELTMIHEVMVLDHGGVDLGFIEYAVSLKLWVFTALLVGVAIPLRTDWPLLNLLIGIASVFITAVIVGVIESTMARLRLLRVPQLLVTASILAVIAVLWVLR